MTKTKNKKNTVKKSNSTKKAKGKKAFFGHGGAKGAPRKRKLTKAENLEKQALIKLPPKPKTKIENGARVIVTKVGHMYHGCVGTVTGMHALWSDPKSEAQPDCWACMVGFKLPGVARTPLECFFRIEEIRLAEPEKASVVLTDKSLNATKKTKKVKKTNNNKPAKKALSV